MTSIIKQNTKALALNRSTTYLLGGLIIVAAFLYFYLINATVHSLTALEKTKRQVQTLSVKVSEMESKRLQAENDVNAEKALHLGFVEVKNPNFIVKNSHKAALSFKTE